MNEILAQRYDTYSKITSEQDLEKNAAAEFLVKLAAEEGVDLDSLSDAEVSELLGEIEKNASAPDTETTDEQEKLAEADFLGRAMAHAYVDELAEIDKVAGRGVGSGGIESGPKDAPGWGAKAMEKAQRIGKGQEAYAARGKGGEKGVKGLLNQLKGFHTTGGKQISSALAKGSKEKLLSRLGRAAGGAAHFAPAAAGVGALGYGAYKALGGGSEKRSFDEQLETAAQHRAYQMLLDAGYDLEKVAEADITTRALQMLESAGYPVNWE